MATPTTIPPEAIALEAEIRAKLRPGASALYKAKKAYLEDVRKDLAEAPEYHDKAVLNAKMAGLEKALDNQIMKTALKGGSEGGNPTVYENAVPTAMEGVQKKIANNVIEKIFSYIPFGELLYDILSKFINVDAITEGVKGLFGIPPKYTKDEKAMAGALDALQKEPVSLQVGRKFALTGDQAAAVYDQRLATPPPAPPAHADNHVPDGHTVPAPRTPAAPPGATSPTVH